MSEDVNVEGMTRGDFEQMLQDQTDTVVSSVHSVDDRLSKQIESVRSDVRILSDKIDRVGERTAEDTTLALSKIAVVEGEIAQIKRQLIHA